MNLSKQKFNEQPPSLTRREILKATSLTALATPLPGKLLQPALPDKKTKPTARAVIILLNVGGPSQLDCFDPKPAAPAEIRGPFRPISTASSAFQLSELLPEHARHADKFSLIRSCCHSEPPLHEFGLHLMQTGKSIAANTPFPYVGSVLDFLQPSSQSLPTHVILPGGLSHTGRPLSQGQSAGFLGNRHEPCFWESEITSHSQQNSFSNRNLYEQDHSLQKACDLREESVKRRDQYGNNRLGRSCLRARRLVEAGVRCVTINTFQTVFDTCSWDIHGSQPFTTLADMARAVTPQYDRAYGALLGDLQERGLLDETLVCSLAEFGRTPRLNPQGGRDHWTHCFTTYFAGGGVQGGRVIGQSDEWAAYPVERPVSPPELVATIYRALGIDQETLLPVSNQAPMRLIEPGIEPVHELF